MKKIISIFLLLLMSSTMFLKVEAEGSIEVNINGIVIGYVLEEIEPQDVSITISDPYVFDGIDVGDVVTNWFEKENGSAIPVNLAAKVKQVSDHELIVTFTGEIEYTEPKGESRIIVIIPDGFICDTTTDNIHCGEQYNAPTDNAKFIIYDSQPSASYYEESTISGTVNKTLDEQYVKILLENCLAIDNIVDQQFSQENGLSAIVKSYESNIITLKYNGVPINEDHNLIHHIVKKEYLRNVSQDLTVLEPYTVKYDINPEPIVIVTPEPKYDPPAIIYEIPTTGIE